MTDKTKNNVRKWFALFFTVWTVLVGLAFIVQVWRIYAIGGDSFTPERIGAYFRQICVPVYVWLATVVAGFVIWALCPPTTQKVKPYIDLRITLTRLQSRLPNDTDGAKKWQMHRAIACGVCLMTAIACSVVAIVYLVGDVTLSAKKGFFANHSEAERIVRAFVWILAAVGVAIGAAYFTESRYQKEISVAKETLAQNAKNGVKVTNKEEKTTVCTWLKKHVAWTESKWFTLGLRVAIGVVAVVFIITGIIGGGVADVLEKAVNICSQCIGIG